MLALISLGPTFMHLSLFSMTTATIYSPAYQPPFPDLFGLSKTTLLVSDIPTSSLSLFSLFSPSNSPCMCDAVFSVNAHWLWNKWPLTSVHLSLFLLLNVPEKFFFPPQKKSFNKFFDLSILSFYLNFLIC